MAKKAKDGAAGGTARLASAQQAAVARTQLLAARAEEIGLLAPTKADEYPRLAPSKGALSAV